MDFLLDRLPRKQYDIFVDASTSWWIGGCCGKFYFKMSWTSLMRMRIQVDGVARMELLSALVSILCFEDLIARKLVRLYIDNENAYSWLKKSRSSNIQGTRFLAMWEFGKHRAECKVRPIWLPSEHNVTADALSRGTVPKWLKRHGVRRRLSRRHVEVLTNNPVKTCLNVLK